MAKIAGIYRITSPSGKVYIGQSINILARWRDHNRRKYNRVLNNSLKKHGFENHLFEILEEIELCDFIESKLNEREVYYIDFYKTNLHRYRDGNGMNLTDGGEGNRGFKHTDEAKRKVSLSKIGKPSWNKGIPGSCPSQLGHKRSEKTRKLLSESKKGNNYWLGKRHSEQTKKLLSKITGRKGEENGRAKLTITQVAEIRRIYVGSYGQSIELAIIYGVSKSTIQRIGNNVSWNAEKPVIIPAS